MTEEDKGRLRVSQREDQESVEEVKIMWRNKKGKSEGEKEVNHLTCLEAGCVLMNQRVSS